MGVEAATTDEEGNATSSVLKITADGKDIEQVGNTMVFAETGLDPVDGYTLPKDIETRGGTVNIIDSTVSYPWLKLLGFLSHDSNFSM